MKSVIGLFSNLFLLFSFILCLGCSSPQLQVTSNPEGASIFAIDQNGHSTSLGKTPVTLDDKMAPELFREQMQIQVSKDGYSPQIALVPKLSLGGSGYLYFTLDETKLPPACQSQSDAVNEIARGIAESSALLQRKKFIEASNLLDNLTTKYTTIPTLYDLQGTAAYLQKNLGKALEFYKRSYQLAPNNPQTLRMISRIQAMQGGTNGGGQ
jgi:hypothetical protein